MAATDAMAIPKLQEFKFMVQVMGMPAALAQSFDPGDRKHGIIKVHGGGMNHAHKETGMIEYEDAVLTVVIPCDGPGMTIFETWANMAANPKTGNADSNDYGIMITVLELAPNGVPKRAHDFFNCQISVRKLGKREAGSLDKPVIEEMHIAYDRREERYL